MKLPTMAGASAIGMFLAHPKRMLVDAGSMVSQQWTQHDMQMFHTSNRRELLATPLDGNVDRSLLSKERREKEEGGGEDEDGAAYNGEHPAENEDEIDCSQFTNLDDLPPFCQESQKEQGTYPVTDDTQDQTQEPGAVDTSLGVIPGGTTEATFVDNTIRVQLSVGIHLLEEITEERVELLLWLVIQVASVLLDRYTPFDVYAPSNGEEFMYMESHGGEGEGDEKSGSNGSAYAGTYEDNGDQLLATLYYSSIATWNSPDWDAWLQLSMEYVAYWPSGLPVAEQESLQQIEEASRQVINMTVDALKFWNELLQQDEDGQYVLRDGYPWEELDCPTIVAVVKVGEEYELDSAAYGKSESDTNSSNSRSPYGDRKVPLESLSTEWSVREWFGLGLCVSTVAIATLLTVVSSRLHRRETTKLVWGLTEQGVGELLNVGWTYHQEERNGQLYLKIFDKGRMGYTDDNSVLGGDAFATGIAEVATQSASEASPDS